LLKKTRCRRCYAVVIARFLSFFLSFFSNAFHKRKEGKKEVGEKKKRKKERKKGKKNEKKMEEDNEKVAKTTDPPGISLSGSPPAPPQKPPGVLPTIPEKESRLLCTLRPMKPAAMKASRKISPVVALISRQRK